MIATQYQLEHDEFKHVDVLLDMRRGENGLIRWAIVESQFVFGTDGEWAYEPRPSSRDDAFYTMYRFSSVEEALKVWFGHDGRSRFRVAKDLPQYRLSQAEALAFISGTPS